MLIFILVILILSVIAVFYPQSTGQAIKQEYARETAILERVIDGDTLVYRIDNQSYNCRLLGINTPEKNMPFSGESKTFLQGFENQTVQLLRDKEDTDKYNRKLRYIFSAKGERFLNLEILENGFANSYYTEGLSYESQLLRAETQAKVAGIGIWTKSQDSCSSCIVLRELNSTGEYFTILNQCNYSCLLDGWFVKDAGRNTFYLSNLSPQESKTYSSNGKEVWNNDGDRLFIFDEKGLLVFFYQYP